MKSAVLVNITTEVVVNYNRECYVLYDCKQLLLGYVFQHTNTECVRSGDLVKVRDGVRVKLSRSNLFSFQDIKKNYKKKNRKHVLKALFYNLFTSCNINLLRHFGHKLSLAIFFYGCHI